MDIGTMFGFIKENNGQAVIANRIFETRLYNLFLSEELTSSAIYQSGERDKNQFVQNGILDMKQILEKFTTHFHDIYGENTEIFVELQLKGGSAGSLCKWEDNHRGDCIKRCIKNEKPLANEKNNAIIKNLSHEINE